MFERYRQLSDTVEHLANRINQLLYVQGKGYWRAGQPDGSSNEVRHCYDLLSVLDNMFEDLTGAQKQFLRMGPRNVGIIKVKLRQIALALGIPSDQLPAL